MSLSAAHHQAASWWTDPRALLRRLPVVHRMSETTFSTISNAQLAIRAAGAAALAAAIALSLKLDHPIYAVLAAIIATDLTPRQSRQLGLRRLAATLLGALGGALISVT